MINQVTLVGRVVEKPTLHDYEGEFKVTTLILAVSRPFKNMEGNIDTDFFRITLWNANAENVCEYTDKGDILGIKGRLVMKDAEVCFTNGEEFLRKKINIIEIIGERVIFIHAYNKKNIIPSEEIN